jgi:ferric-dicitrate binding protein FerR (iron transport regulator)
MTGDPHDIVAILVKYAFHEPLTEEEQLCLHRWRQRSAEHAALPEQFRDQRWLEDQRKQLHAPPTEAMWTEIRHYIDYKETSPVFISRTSRRIGFAWYPLAILLIAGMIYGGMRWSRTRRLQPPVIQAALPLGVKALLTLEDGNSIVLDTIKKGATIVDGELRMRKTDSNSFVYIAAPPPDPDIRNRLTIAPGAGVYRIQWVEGSSAWLNSGTSVDFAVDLRSAVLKVEGEAWFRMRHDPMRPVSIELGDGTLVRILGTSVKVRSVKGGDANGVALFSGKIRVVKGADSLELRPGWQATTGGAHIETAQADSDRELAWMRPALKNRDLKFEDADLSVILPEIAARFRLEVVNPKKLRGVGITGDFARELPLRTLIESIMKVESPYVRMDLLGDTLFIAPLKPGH